VLHACTPKKLRGAAEARLGAAAPRASRPRPEETWLVERYSTAERFRLDIRPGITGPMQVHGRGELSFQERIAVEREYVENFSFSKDVQLLLRTVPALWSGRGAF